MSKRAKNPVTIMFRCREVKGLDDKTKSSKIIDTDLIEENYWLRVKQERFRNDI